MTTQIPSTQRAIVIDGPKQATIHDNVPVPKLRPGTILVKVVAVAINPTDWKHIDFLPSEGSIVGCDYAGTVVAVAEGVKRDFKPGQAVFGFSHGSDAVQPENGCFAEYSITTADIQMKKPQNLSFEHASTLGVGTCTVGQCWQRLELEYTPEKPYKGSEKKYLMIYGGSTATGALTIQTAKLSGYTPIVTCSPSNFDLVKQYGAVEAFDYNDPACPQKIKDYTNDSVLLAIDCISTKDSAAICAPSLAKGAKYCKLLGVDLPDREDVKQVYVLAYSVLGDYFRMGPTGPEFPASKEDLEHGIEWSILMEKLLAEGKISVHNPDVRKGGLEGVLEGMQEMREGKVSGKKLVYDLA